MRKHLALLQWLPIILLLGACTEDDLIDYPAPHVGDEIVFGASALYEAGNEDAKKSRTAYGEPNEAENKIAINWAAQDQIDILCPQALAAKEATYEVQVGTAPDSTSTQLKRITPDKGLQWSDAPEHHFFAVYPSMSQLDFSAYGIEKADLGFVKNATDDGFTGSVGYLPIVQTNNAKIEEIPPVQNIKGNDTYVVAPDMRYAYMIAEQTVTTQEAGNGVFLRFHPLVTALEFQITLGDILNANTGQKQEIQLVSAVLSSVDGSDICGMFKCQQNAEGLAEIIDANPADKKGSHNQVTVELPRGIVLSKEKNPSCNVTFFLLPTSNFQKGNLRLKIFYELNKNIQFKSCIIGVDIQPRKKYFFKNLQLPPLNMNVDGSIWFSGIEDNVLMSQVSIPCAGNAFSNYAAATDINYKQQVHDYITLWKQGVRGFEFVNEDVKTDDGTVSLDGEPFICGEKRLTGENVPRFGQAIEALANLLTDPAYKNEFLVIIAKYHAVAGGFNPQRYVKQLLNSLSKLHAKNNAIQFVKLRGDMTTADLRGKIAVIIRPADDDYMKFEFNDKNASTSNITLTDNDGNDWSDRVILVHNWGKAYDRFDMRYPGYTREATWGDKVYGVDKIKRIEDYLWAVSDGNDGNTNFVPAAHRDYNDVKREYNENEENDTLPSFPSPSPKYEHQTTADFTAQIQEWARVIPENAPYSSGYGVYTGHYRRWNYKPLWSDKYYYRYLFVRWKPSIMEKKQAIGTLFNNSTNRNALGLNSSLFINVMSGYFPSVPTGTTPHELQATSKSVMPFKYDFDLDWDDWSGGGNWSDDELKKFGGTEDIVTPQGQGNDGNYAALAAELNRYLFNLLARRVGTDGTPAGPKLQEGPYGLVVMDFIGADAQAYQDHAHGEFNTASDYADAAFASRALVYMIMMNNFKFPLDHSNQGQVNEDLVIDQSKDEVVAE